MVKTKKPKSDSDSKNPFDKKKKTGGFQSMGNYFFS